MVRDPLLIFGSQTGWCLLVTGYADLARFLLRILFIAVAPRASAGPDLVPVDRLGDRCAAVADHVADVLDADAAGGKAAQLEDFLEGFRW